MTELWQSEVEKNIETLRALLEERRQGAPELRDEVKALGVRMDTFEGALAANTKVTQSISGDTSELLDVFKSVKGGFRVLGWMGAAAKWVAGIAAAGVALWQMWQKWTGKP